jgi:hypothetical protein
MLLLLLTQFKMTEQASMSPSRMVTASHTVIPSVSPSHFPIIPSPTSIPATDSFLLNVVVLPVSILACMLICALCGVLVCFIRYKFPIKNVLVLSNEPPIAPKPVVPVEKRIEFPPLNVRMSPLITKSIRLETPEPIAI